MCAGAIKLRQNDEGAGEITVTAKPAGSERVLVEWSGLRQLDHDPFRSFAGSDEIKLALAAKIIEAHGGRLEVGPVVGRGPDFPASFPALAATSRGPARAGSSA